MPIETLGALLRSHGHADAMEAKTVFNLADEFYLSNGYDKLAAARGISRGWSGGPLNETTALQLSAVFACVKILGEDVGSLPLHVLERSADGKSQNKARSHPLYRLLHDSPNPETTAIEFREGMTSTAALCGDAFAKSDWATSDKSRLIALWQVQNHQVTIDTDSRKQRVYIFKDGNEPEETLYPDEMFHLRGFSLGTVNGASFLKFARRVLGLARDQEEYAHSFFSNDRTPGVVLKSPKKMAPEEVAGVREAWVRAVKQHGVAVAHDGIEVDSMASTNTDAQLLEQRNFALLEVCRYFRMPPHKLADLSRANFTNIENENNGYYTNTLRPWLVRWEQAINLRCISVKERARFSAEHSIEGFLRGDFKTQTEGFAKFAEKGVLSVNEIRAFIGLNPIEGGDEHFIQLNMQTLVNAATGETAPEPVEDPAVKPAAAGNSRLVRVKGMFT